MLETSGITGSGDSLRPPRRSRSTLGAAARAVLASARRWLTTLGTGLLPRRPWPKDRGERSAARHCLHLGWEILAANIRIGHDEGDLLCLDERGEPVLVEVKSSSGGPIDPVFHVDRAKAACLRRLALALSHDDALGRAGWRGRVPRIDVVTVRLGSTPADDRVERHYRQAIEEGPRPPRRGVLRP